MVSLFYLLIITATITVKCDLVYFKNDTIDDLLYAAQMSQRESCLSLPDGVVITMISTTNHDKVCSTGTQNIPIGKMAVKNLITQANKINNSSQLLYLFTDDGELTEGGSTWKNLSARQLNCILAKRNVVVLKPKAADVEKALPLIPLSLQTVLTAEYMHDDDDNYDINSKTKNVFSITPNIAMLTKVVSHFIITTGWTRVGILYDNTVSEFVYKMKKMTKSFQLFVLKYDGSNANDISDQFKKRNIRIILYTGLVQTYLQALDDLYDYYYTGIGIGWIYASVQNSFPFGYNLSELIKCLQRDHSRVYYGLSGSISIVLSEGYGRKHEQFRSLIKTLITQEGYALENDQSIPLLQTAYAVETASILINALNYFITEQKWNYRLIKLAMQRIKQLSIKHNGITGSVTIDSDKKEVNSTFAVYNVIPSSSVNCDKNTFYIQPRAYIFYAKSVIHTQYVNVNGVNSSTPTIVYADGTTNPPWSTPEQLILTPIIDTSQHWTLVITVIQSIMIITISLYTLYIYYHGEKKYEHLNAKWMYRRGDINFCNVPRNIRKLLQKNRFPNSFQISQLPLQVGLFKDTMVYIRKVNFDSKTASQYTRNQIAYFSELHHPNVNPFIGCIVESNFTAIMTKYCSRRSLKIILTNTEFILDCLVKLSFISDAAMGLQYLHSKRIIHERLHLNNCLVDEYWILKLSDYSIEVFNNKEIEQFNTDTSTLSYCSSTNDNDDDNDNMDYLAPEIKETGHKPTKSSDIYSFGYVSNAITTAQSMAKSATHFSNRNATIIKELNKLVAQCMKSHCINRPSIELVTATLAKLNNSENINSHNSTVGRDNLLEAYAKNLEESLEEKTKYLENLEAAIIGEIPKPLIKQINEGKTVPIQKYEQAAILVVIIGQVEEMTNPKKLHKTSAIVAALQKILASVICKNNLLKVEQTGSKCVFASGVYDVMVDDPIAEVADAAIHMNSMCGKGSLTDDSDVEPNLKMAIHTGTVICGVTQEEYPKHVIYGTTLDFATSIAINAPSNSIYVSYQVARHLQNIGRFNVKYARELECEKSVEILYQLQEKCGNEELKLFKVMPRRGSRCSRRGSTIIPDFQQLCMFEECQECDDPFQTMPI